ncbi:MAG TPA: hypothetical protein VJ810_01690 [Blastocatellia bacterium]|nr:hypothetical protein [Blastocatellia bacterium]
MMYSQQEYDMVRRQTMQIEAEKRALLRWALIGVSALMIGSLFLTAWMFRRYSLAEDLVRNADEKRASAESQLQQVNRELAEKKAILEKSAAEVAKQNASVASIVPKMLSKSATPADLAELAHAVYQTPGHVIGLPSIPPDKIIGRRYKIRVGEQLLTYILVAGEIEDKWMLYSLLVRDK